MSTYLPIFAMMVVVVLFVLLSFIASQILGPRRPNAAKAAPYECGIVPENEPAERFPVKFYLVAMSFIVLDVEIVFLYPFATVFREFGAFGMVAMAAFVAGLLIPFGYLISVGALAWGPRQIAAARQAVGAVRRTSRPVFEPVGTVSDEAA